MSLVSTYVKCTDGKWYRNPVYRAKDKSWFICFDDNDPVELVVKKNCQLGAEQILKEVGIRYTSISSGGRGGSRCFEKGKFSFTPALAYFISTVRQTFPIPNEWDEIFEQYPHKEGVYYGEGVEV